MKFIKSIFLSFTIWISMALLNALLSGAVLSFFSNESNPWPGKLFLVFIFTLILSLPGIFIFWIVLVINWNEGLLFRILLNAGLIISALSSLLLFVVPDDDVKSNQLLISLCLVVATGTSVMIHHSKVKSICRNNTEYHV